MTTKLFVGNIPASVSHTQIRTLFMQAGEVDKISFVRDHDKLTTKGVAFVMMTTEAGREEAIKRFNGYSIGEQTEQALVVRLARLRPNKLRSGRIDKTDKTVGNSSETL